MAAKAKELCRLCAEPRSAEVVQHSIEDPEVRSKLETVFNFEVPSREPLPEVVCQECFTKVTDWYSYHETVRSNQTQLMSIATTAEDRDAEFAMGCVKVEIGNEDNDAEELPDTEAKIEEEQEDHSDSSESSEEPVPKRPKRAVATVKRKYTKRSPLERQKPKPNKKKLQQIEEDNRKIQDFFKLTCEFCSESFDVLYRLQLHTRRVHNARASVKCCGRVMYRKHKIVDHIDSHLNPDRFHCDICNRDYQGRYHFEHHNMKKHSNIKKPFKCDKCKACFPKKYFLSSHMLSHIKVKCPVCHRMMASSLTLRAHMALMHGDKPKEKKVLICETCGEEFRTKMAMDRHVKKHLGLSPTERVQCHICSKWVSGKAYLKVHIKTLHYSEENQSVECPICQRVYPNSRALSKHKGRVHVEEKFECEFCGKKFKRKVSLTEHRASHTGQSLYSCNVCGMTTNSNANLYSHKKSKHPEEWLEAKKKAAQMNQG